MRHKAPFASLIFVWLIASVVGWGSYRNSRLSNRFELVTVGTSDEQVRHVLGRPSWIEPCGKSLGNPRANCTEYIYRNSFAPFVPEYFSVSLDTSGHVLEKYVYESP
jgi:hypothetical protein